MRFRAFMRLTFGPALFLAALAGGSSAASGVLLINESASLPQGLYRRAHVGAPKAGDIVALRPPPAARRYVAGLGLPPSAKLLKRVAATEGQTVCATRAAIHVNGRSLPVRRRDRRGLLLPSWTGCRTLQRGEVFVIGDTSASFDGRYFGPVRMADISGVYREVATW